MPTSTITGTIRNTSHENRGNVQVLFTPSNTPFVDSDDHVITTTPKTAITNSSGGFSVELVDGTYVVRIYRPNGTDYDEVTIVVPSTAGTYDISDLITSTPATVGYFSCCLSFDAPYAVGNGEYIGGRHRFNVLSVLKSASIVVNGVSPTGAAFVVQLEVNGSLVASQTMTVNAGGTSAEATLSDVQVAAGQYIRWKVTSGPSDPENFPSNVYISTNVTT